MGEDRIVVSRDGVDLSVVRRGGRGPLVLLLHGLAGSACELLPTADALTDAFTVALVDQRGHGRSTRRPADLSRAAFVDDVVAVIARLSPGDPAILVGQSVGAHTAFLTAAARPDLVSRLVMLEGHAAGSDDPAEAAGLGAFFASWPAVFADAAAARAFLGDGVLADAWIADLEPVPGGLRPRFDADVMQRILEAVHVPRWREWEGLSVPTLAVFAENGMFSEEQKAELIARRPATARADIAGASHDAHLDALEAWTAILRAFLLEGTQSDA